MIVKGRKWWVVLLAAVVLAIIFFILRSRSVETNPGAGSDQKVGAPIAKTTPTVLVTKDEDGYGLQILAKDFKKVRKVEMLIKYTYRGKENPPLVATGAPQQDSYWAHFRLESCSRGDCLHYKVSEVGFSLALSYEDGESRDYAATVEMAKVLQESPLTLR